MVVTALQKLSAPAQACIRALTNLRQLEARLPLTPDLLAMLQPLTALTQLHLVSCQCYQCADHSALTCTMSSLIAGKSACISTVTNSGLC